MAKRSAPTSTLSHDFTFASDADLNAQIAAFQAAHAAARNELLAMDARRSLGPCKVRITFRIRPRKGER
jgi:hypothetical protein